MFLITTPIVLSMLAVIGIIWSFRKGSNEEKFIVLNAIYPFLLILLIPARYDGIRHILPAYPFIVLLAGIGLHVLMQTRIRFVRPISTIIVSGMIGLTVYTGFVRIHPYEQIYYNELVGGVKGANELGFETEYWGSSYLGIIPWINSHKLNKFCIYPTSFPFQYYQETGHLASGITFDASPEICEYLVVLMRQGLINQYPVINSVISTGNPEFAIFMDSVPLVAVYSFPKEPTEIILDSNESD
jgi:hypothetical protein